MYYSAVIVIVLFIFGSKRFWSVSLLLVFGSSD